MVNSTSAVKVSSNEIDKYQTRSHGAFFCGKNLVRTAHSSDMKPRSLTSDIAHKLSHLSPQTSHLRHQTSHFSKCAKSACFYLTSEKTLEFPNPSLNLALMSQKYEIVVTSSLLTPHCARRTPHPKHLLKQEPET